MQIMIRRQEVRACSCQFYSRPSAARESQFTIETDALAEWLVVFCLPLALRDVYITIGFAVLNGQLVRIDSNDWTCHSIAFQFRLHINLR